MQPDTKVRGFDLRSAAIEDADFEEVVGAFDDGRRRRVPASGRRSAPSRGLHVLVGRATRDRLSTPMSTGRGSCSRQPQRRRSAASFFASSGEVYPENRPAFQRLPRTIRKSRLSPYGLTKLIGEELVMFQGRVSSMETVILRFSHTQNADELSIPKASFPDALLPSAKDQAAGRPSATRPQPSSLRAAGHGRPALV